MPPHAQAICSLSPSLFSVLSCVCLLVRPRWLFLLPARTGKKVVIPLCGGNIDVPVLGRVIDRGLAADMRLVRFVTTVSDRPGGIAELAAS